MAPGFGYGVSLAHLDRYGRFSMHRLLMFSGTTIGGLLGWWMASSGGIVLAFFVSSVGSVLGLYLGWRIGRDYF